MLTVGRTDGCTDARMDRRMDDGQKVITIAHPEQSSGELKIVGLLANRSLDTQHSRANTGQSPSVRIKRLSNTCSPNF